MVGLYYVAVGDWESADVCLELLLDLDPDHPTSRVLELRLMSAALREAVDRLSEEAEDARPRPRTRTRPK